MNRRNALAALLAVGAAFSAVAGNATQHRVIVTSNGWHSGITLAHDHVPLAILPEAADFPDAAYLEFGWGDADYYPAPRPTFGLALTAAFPGPALMHVSGLPAHPTQVFPGNSMLIVTLAADQKQRLLAALAASFDRRSFDGTGTPRAIPTGHPGLYPFSRFYPATGRFHAFNTCNTWTARILAAAGLPIQAHEVQTADELMRRLRPLAEPG